MPAPLSPDLLLRGVKLVLEENVPVRRAARQLRIDRGTLRAALLRRAAGEPLAARGRRGVQQLSTRMTRCGGYDVLRDLVAGDECLFLDELRDELRRRTGERFHLSSVSRALKRLGFSKKSVSARRRPLTGGSGVPLLAPSAPAR